LFVYQEEMTLLMMSTNKLCWKRKPVKSLLKN